MTTLGVLVTIALLPTPSDWRAVALGRLHAGPPAAYSRLLKAVVPLRAKTQKDPGIAAPSKTPPQSMATSGDPRSFVIDAQGRKTFLPDPVLDGRLHADIKALIAAQRKPDLTWIKAFLQRIPSQAAAMDLDAFSFDILRAHFLAAGLLVADAEGSQTEAEQYLRTISPTDWENSIPGVLLPVYLARAGCRAPEFLNEMDRLLGRRNREPSSFFKDKSLSAVSDPVLLAELLAITDYSMHGWFTELHARRALALNPNQAHSAVVLMPILTRTGRAEESLKLAEQALKFATGRAERLLKGGVYDAKCAVYRKTGVWRDKP